MIRIKGELEIDTDRGVIYFHSSETGWTVLRICKLGKINEPVKHIDITHMTGMSIE